MHMNDHTLLTDTLKTSRGQIASCHALVLVFSIAWPARLNSIVHVASCAVVPSMAWLYEGCLLRGNDAVTL